MADAAHDSASFDLLHDSHGPLEASAQPEAPAEELTTGEVRLRLQSAWINEKFAPELLPPQTQVLECMLEQMDIIRSNLAEVGPTDFRVPLHRMEMQRIRFLMAAYLRLRLDKIQKFIFTLDTSEEALNLTSEERQFARSHRNTLEGHLSHLALSHMPGDFGQILPRKAEPKYPEPNLPAAVFVQVNRPVAGVFLEDETLQGKDDEVDFLVGEQHIVRYKAVAQYVKDGSLKLI
eukprot:maker-scaffold426_size175065-snap-gene-0.38 protein:Tk08649 transcript:maker-scaffold426_size175065-snap-gene-0.38-mRNA-1 annotation:"dna replication complex gins protein sld5-like"